VSRVKPKVTDILYFLTYKLRNERIYSNLNQDHFQKCNRLVLLVRHLDHINTTDSIREPGKLLINFLSADTVARDLKSEIRGKLCINNLRGELFNYQTSALPHGESNEI